jgi:hypothetical protein
LPFFCACRHPTNCQGRKAKICGVSGSGDESLDLKNKNKQSTESKRGTKCTQKPHVQKCMGSLRQSLNQLKKGPDKSLKNEHGGKWAIRTWVYGSRNAGVAG